MTTKSSYDWLKYVEKTLVQADAIPLLGNSAPFPLSELQKSLQELFEVPLNLEVKEWHWLNVEEMLRDFDREDIQLTLKAEPLLGEFYVMIKQRDLCKLSSWFILKKKSNAPLLSGDFLQGFASFVALKSLDQLEKLDYFQGLNFKLMSHGEKPIEKALCLDVQLQYEKETLSFKLALSESFKRGWVQRLSSNPPHFSPESLESTQVSCHLDIAKLAFSIDEWQDVKSGDFIPLQGSNLDLKNQTGSFTLSMNHLPLYRVRLKEKGLKILEQPIYEEANMDEMDHEMAQEQEVPLENTVSSEVVEESLEDEGALKNEPAPQASIGEVPLNITVELARFKMSVQKLMQLSPGNLLELNVSLDEPVSLVANGKKIATGELIKVGHTLGVRILNR
jgi:flagellar motor switch protein FliN/FliY